MERLREERDRKRARKEWDECYEREKSVARENSAHIILPRYNEEAHVPGKRVPLPRVISARIRKSPSRHSRGSDRSSKRSRVTPM